MNVLLLFFCLIDEYWSIASLLVVVQVIIEDLLLTGFATFPVIDITFDIDDIVRLTARAAAYITVVEEVCFWLLCGNDER